MLKAAGLMRAGVVLAALIPASATAWATAVRTPEQAAKQVHAEGFGLVSKTDKGAGSWEVWASKEGVPYRIRVDAESGSIVAALPAQDND